MNLDIFLNAGLINIILFIICLILPVIIILLICINVLKLNKWKKTKGSIIFYDIIEEPSILEEVNKKAFTYKIKYEYKIIDNIYYGNKINIKDFQFANKKYFNKLSEKYKIGDIIDVYYNPKKYNECYLERGFNKITILSIVIVLFVFLLINFIILFTQKII